MKIEQFENKGLSHYSYAILSESENKIVIIDPCRNITSYLSYAAQHQAEITAVIETHPHADFVSGHLELHRKTRATIYCSGLLAATYPHKSFDGGDVLQIGEIKFKAINTPGHSPDSISIVLEDESKDIAVFTGDTLFIGDCGRPDLRETAGNQTAKREDLARQMYHSLRDKLLPLEDGVWVFPAHGAGTLCGKLLSDANRSTIGAERMENWALQDMTEQQFVETLLEDQPFIPKYFGYDVELNKNGAINLNAALLKIPNKRIGRALNHNLLVVDTRAAAIFKQCHIAGAINIQSGARFETWLGSIIAPGEIFYLIADNEAELQKLTVRSANIGYENFIESVFVFENGNAQMEQLDLADFKANLDKYTILDVRNVPEVKEHPAFKNAINIPLHQLRERVLEIPFENPIVVHCAAGYRSAAGSSIVYNALKGKTRVFDLGEAIEEFI